MYTEKIAKDHAQYLIKELNNNILNGLRTTKYLFEA